MADEGEEAPAGILDHARLLNEQRRKDMGIGGILERVQALGPGDERLDAEDEEEVNRRYRERFRQAGLIDRGMEEEAGGVGQQSLLPNPSDPKLWSVRCRPGKERETVCQVMNKANFMRSKSTPLHIYSVACREDVK